MVFGYRGCSDAHVALTNIRDLIDQDSYDVCLCLLKQLNSL